MCQYVIELTGLTKKYGDFTAVNDLNLQIRKGEIFGLLGPNGAGKSTTILMMLGLTEPTTGSVKVCDIDSTTHPIEVKRKIGFTGARGADHQDIALLHIHIHMPAGGDALVVIVHGNGKNLLCRLLSDHILIQKCLDLLWL